ncbi:unnamed protein product [Enterobius vermicularis]|uniref:Lipase_3 domain-containing protein n=1 Tax=Enterobius vermicularis TaxID=51028 RepID=A0A0N4UZE4_ENTVE|nr:unnamed protein product [Enterobius vermicularis]
MAKWDLNSASCKKRPYFHFFISCDMKFATDCPKPVKPGFEFNATFTKLIMYRIAVAAYVNNPTKCLSRFADDVVVSSFYARVFQILWEKGIEDDILRLARQHPEYELWIAGISMGGSLATLASRAVVFGKIHDPNKIRLVTFGEPRVFDREFAKIHNYMINRSPQMVKKTEIKLLTET